MEQIKIVSRFDSDNIKVIGKYTDIKEATKKNKADLSGADLSGADLSGADLSWADLSEADLSGANLSGADLSWADLYRADFSEADLSGADLSWADLSWANLHKADLSWADLSGAKLYKADLPKNNIIINDRYFIHIQINKIRVGCEIHTLSWWKKLSYKSADKIDNAGDWWKQWKPRILAIHGELVNQDNKK